MRKRDGEATGSIRAWDLGRRFEITSGGPRSLKQTLLRRDVREKRELWAVRNLDLDISPGETFGIVGRNGSGKSTLLKLLAGVFAPTEGRLDVVGRVGSLLELGAGFHPEFSGVENVYLNAAIHGLKRSYVDDELDEIISFAELEEFAHMPVKTYSSGMFTRLGFSIAVHINPDILLIDEVLAVGDEAFQQKCYGKIWDFKRAGGTLVFVSHDPGAVERLCDRAILLEEGTIMEEGSAEDVLRAYHHRLTGRAPSRIQTSPDGSTGPCQITDVRAVGGDGARRDRFLEGEPVMLEAQLYSGTGVRAARVTIGLREASGRPIGSQTATGVDVPSGRPEAVRLHLLALPVREGRFFVDVRVVSHDGDAQLAERERALELTVFGDDPAAAGPVRLAGTWEITSAAGESIPAAVER